MKKTIYMTLMIAIISLVGFNVDTNAQNCLGKRTERN
jgi:hypothetical protein